MDYTYTLDQFPNEKFDLSKLTREIGDTTIVTALDFLSGEEDSIIIHFKADLSTEDLTTLSGVVSVHDGADDGLSDIQYVDIKSVSEPLPTDLIDEYRDRSGKLRVHQTSRKLGTMIMWSGEGDDQTNPSVVGGGETLAFGHFVGQTEPLVKYIDFNVVENETWLHEGYVTWCKCKLDTLNLSIVPRVTSTAVSSNTDYNLYGGYLIIPAVPGTGTIDITSDITTHSGGLVYIPDNDLGEQPQAFWNANWNTTTKQYEDITAAPAGNGRYNMFSLELTIAKFVRSMPLLDSGFIALNSSDTDQLGHGIRLKMEAFTNTTISGVGDHDWSVACTLCLHRNRSV